ncbi:MAG: arsenite methyltransferase [Bacteroidales bacterium]|nr:MAG: arsenite methyltransferase [Bacteroidales bacterium]
MDQKDIKQTVKEKYSQIAMQSKQENETSCCGATGCCSGVDYTIFSENYNQVKGYSADADLGLGCGIPTEYANIKEGDTVVDLGSGAGNDCFVARAIVGEYGKVIGLDMTEAMIAKARENAKKLNYSNVEFVLGDIENMPINTKVADVVISNCVLNLVPNKQKAFEEIYRILKNGGHFSISDVVIKGELPEKIKQAAEMYAGCVAGAIDKDEYIRIIERSGFVDVMIQKEKQITVPDDILLNYLSEAELKLFKEAGTGIYSITVYGKKSKGCSCGCNC